MRIHKISLFRYNRPFQFEFKSSQINRAGAEAIILQLEFDNGITGYGESTPRPYVTGENCSTVVSTIKQIQSLHLLSADIEDIEDVSKLLETADTELADNATTPYYSALGAIDTALMDALGKHHQMSSAKFLGHELKRDIAYSIPVPILPLEKTQELYPLIKDFGFKHFKVLLNVNEAENIERVAFLRGLLGEEVNIRLEVNGAWSFEQAVSQLKKLRKFNISAVEQPLPPKNIAGLKKLRKEAEIPIIADESLCSLADAKKLISMEACDMLNIKISKCGGMLKSKKIASFSASQHIPCKLGTHVGETQILTEAGRCLMRSIENLHFYEGFPILLSREALSSGIKKIINNKSKKEPSVYGIGVTEEIRQQIFKYCSLVLEVEPD